MAIGAATIVTALGSAFKTWWGGRQRIKQAKVDAKVAKHKAEAQFQMQLANIEASYDLVALRMSQYTVRDDIIAAIIFGPLAVAFFPPLRPYTEDWLAFLDGLPVWYQIIMFGIVAATFGLRWWFNSQSLKVGAK